MWVSDFVGFAAVLSGGRKCMGENKFSRACRRRDCSAGELRN